MTVCVDKCDVSWRDASPDGFISGSEEKPSDVCFRPRLLLVDGGPFNEDLYFLSGVVLPCIEVRVVCVC